MHTIGDARGGGGGDGALLLEDGRQLGHDGESGFGAGVLVNLELLGAFAALLELAMGIALGVACIYGPGSVGMGGIYVTVC